MYPILARFGPFFIYSYTIVLAIGIVAGLLLSVRLGRRYGIKLEQWLDGLLLGVFVGLIIGRLFFVAANSAYYKENLAEIPLIWRGGISYHGLLVTCIIFLALWTRSKELSFGDTAFILAPALVLLTASSWFACFLEGCAYGRMADPGLFAADLPDSFGIFALRYATQIFGLVSSLLILGLILFIGRSNRYFWLPWLTLLFLSASRLAVTLFRGDSVPMIGVFRLDTAAEGLIITICLGIITFLHFGNRPIKNV